MCPGKFVVVADVVVIVAAAAAVVVVLQFSVCSPNSSTEEYNRTTNLNHLTIPRIECLS